MPSAADFRRHFGLGAGQELNTGNLRATISSSKVGHVVKQQNEHYEFPISLGITVQRGGGRGMAKRLEAALKKITESKQSTIIYSAYGSPYDCTIGRPVVTEAEEGEDKFELHCLGKALRRRDVPTLAKQHEQEGGAAAEPSAAEIRSLQPDFRVIKSRFGTSKCAICHDTIDTGVRIGKRQGEAGRGGWAHAACILAQRQKQAGSGRKKRSPASAAGGKGGKRKAGQEGGGAGKVSKGKRRRSVRGEE